MGDSLLLGRFLIALFLCPYVNLFTTRVILITSKDLRRTSLLILITLVVILIIYYVPVFFYCFKDKIASQFFKIAMFLPYVCDAFIGCLRCKIYFCLRGVIS